MKKLYILFAFLIFANPSYSVSRFVTILKEIDKFEHFEHEANCQTIKEGEKFENLGNKEKNEYLNLKEKKIKKDGSFNKQMNEFIESLRNYADKLIKNEISGCDFLKYLLKTRLKSFVCKPAYLLENTQSLFDPTLPVPFNGFVFNAWTKLYRCEEYRKLNKIASKVNNNRYELVVILIKKTFQSLSIEELDEEAIKFLRASPSIFDLLQNKTLSLGNYDEAGGYIRVQTYMQHFTIGINDAIKKIQNKENCPSWNKIKNMTDLYLYESHFIPKTKFIQFKGLGTPEGSGIVLKLTDYETDECQDDLPYPDFLKIQPEHPFLESESFFDTLDFDQFSDEVDMPEEIELRPTDNINNNIIITEHTNSSDEQLENIIDHSEPTVNNDIISDNTKNQIADNDYLLPSGIRKFHNLMPEAPYSPLNLKKKDQKFVDSIFNSKTSHTISYGEFKKFWNKMSGQIIEDTGSSHKQLIGPNGDALYGVSAHNDAHTYGKKTIKYFRAALYYIGCRPS
ncbi:MAG: hypothetical protein Q8S31_05285 [Alphaproteobacteria bacterium]|nr:hypothetical protein [Alphaproteobacteria bacterium]